MVAVSFTCYIYSSIKQIFGDEIEPMEHVSCVNVMIYLLVRASHGGSLKKE